MASPPYRSPAGSPPQPSHSVLPSATSRKRPQISTPYSQPPKRRKASTYSAASGRGHPLRQASFPPEEATDGSKAERSPSVESDYTAITGRQSLGTVATGRKGKGGRRKRNEGSVKSGSRVASRAKSTADAGGEEDEEADDGDGDDDAGIDAEGIIDEGGKVDRLAENKKMSVLVDALSADQAERYDTYRRIKLKKETLRRIVNQTLSQSVPPSVILTINGFTKVFIGTLVERALDVQAQNAKAADTLPLPSSLQDGKSATTNGTVTNGGRTNGGITNRASTNGATTNGGNTKARTTNEGNPFEESKTSSLNSSTSTSLLQALSANPTVQRTNTIATNPITVDELAPLQSPKQPLNLQTNGNPNPNVNVKKTPLGPLEPNHLREALRRYRKDGEGGGAGVEGFSVGLGIAGARAARLGGRRLFR